MRSSIVGLVAFSLLTAFGSTAFADDAPRKPVATKTRKKAPSKRKPEAPKKAEAKEPDVDVAASEMPEPIATPASASTPNQPPPAAPAPASAWEMSHREKDAIAAAPTTKKEGVAPTGLVFSSSLVALAPLTPLAEGGKVLTAGVGIDLRIGGYFTDHIGITAGFRASAGHMVCHGEEKLCSGIAVQLPLMLEIAQARNNGLYGEVGVGFLTAYLFGKDPSYMRIWTPAVLKGGLGYRIGNLAKGDFERTLAVDVRLGADVGRMTNYSIEGFSDVKDASGSVDNPSLYLSAGLSVGAHFSL